MNKKEKRKEAIKDLALAKAYLRVWFNSEDLHTQTNAIYEVVGYLNKALELLAKDKDEYEIYLWTLSPAIKETIEKNDLTILKCKICNL